MFCGNCGQDIEENIDICPYCGAEIEKEEIAPEVPNKIPIAESQQLSPSSLCPYCGNKDPKEKITSLVKAIFGCLGCFLIFLIFFYHTIETLGFAFFILPIFLILLIFIIVGGIIRKYDRVRCPQCKKVYRIKRKP